MKEILKELIQFRNDRDWEQFHTPKNLAISISIEAAELLEHFQCVYSALFEHQIRFYPNGCFMILPLPSLIYKSVRPMSSLNIFFS